MNGPVLSFVGRLRVGVPPLLWFESYLQAALKPLIDAAARRLDALAGQAPNIRVPATEYGQALREAAEHAGDRTRPLATTPSVLFSTRSMPT